LMFPCPALVVDMLPECTLGLACISGLLWAAVVPMS
jgi:hypothetical protein